MTEYGLEEIMQTTSDTRGSKGINYETLYSGISKMAWGYVFISLDINLGTVSILPTFVGFLLFLAGISLLQGEEPELALLRPFGIVMALWTGADWLASWVAGSVDGCIAILDIIICVVSLYFYFQLLTNLASISRRYQTYGDSLDGKLLTYRTVQTVMVTGTMALTYLGSWLGDIATYLAFGMAIISLIVGGCIIIALFDLRKLFKENTI